MRAGLIGVLSLLQGFELNAEQWFSAKGYQECAVLDDWEDRLKAAGLV